jgi:hypothetical protein
MSTISPTASTSQEAAGATSGINRASEADKQPGVKMAETERVSESDGTFQRPSRRGTRETTASGSTPFHPEPLKKRLTDLFVSERKIKREPSIKESAVAIVKASWLNVLLVFVPVSLLHAAAKRGGRCAHDSLFRRSDGACIGVESTILSCLSLRASVFLAAASLAVLRRPETSELTVVSFALRAASSPSSLSPSCSVSVQKRLLFALDKPLVDVRLRISHFSPFGARAQASFIHS